jgi:TRAP-type C4-dicarboxylate transport system permease small subunit
MESPRRVGGRSEAGETSVLEGATIALLVVMLGSTLIGVADRFVLEIGLPWTEELSRFLLVWASLLAAAVATKRRRHFRIELAQRRLGAPGEAVITVLCVAALAVAIWYGIHIARLFHAQTAPALGIPMSWVYAAVPVSGGLMIFYLLRDLFRRGISDGGDRGSAP